MEINALYKIYETLLPWNLARIKCYLQMVCGMIMSHSVQQHQCALGFQGKAQPESKCRRIRDFFKYFNFDQGDIAKALLALFGIQGPLDMILDRTNWKFGQMDINILVFACKISKNIAIPLFWTMLPTQGNSSQPMRVDLIQKFIDVFGVKMLASILGDREFIGKAWLTFLDHQKIPFYIRIKDNALVKWGDIDKHIKKFFNHLKVAQKRDIRFEYQGPIRYFAGTRSKDGKLVIVMSNQNKGLEILDIYKDRWSIELMFKHCKTNGFNLEDTHLKDIKRIEKLFAVIASAFVLSIMAGKIVHAIKPTPYKKTVSAPLFSIFRRGFDYLRRLFIDSREEAFAFIAQMFPKTKELSHV